MCVEEEADRECVEAAVCGALRYATADVEGVLVCAVVSSIASGEALRGRSSSEVVVVAAINGLRRWNERKKGMCWGCKIVAMGVFVEIKPDQDFVCRVKS